MAAYTRQGDFVALLMSKAEAEALYELAQRGVDELEEDGHDHRNGSTKSAGERAIKALCYSFDIGCRTGARID